LKVLHVHNVAGVACVIAKFMDKMFNTESLVVTRKIFDKYGLMTYGEAWNCSAKVFALKVLLLSRKFDLIHVHDFDKIVPWLKRFYRKPVILHYHGSRIRNRWKKRKKYWSKADVLLYSVKDVESENMPKNAIWMPNPVDTDMFHPVPECLKKPNSALTFSRNADDLALKLAIEKDLHLTINRNKILYSEMPTLLSRFQFYIEVKRDREGQVLGKGNSVSMIALQALACGTKVVKWDGKIIEKLPDIHKPEHVVSELMEIYSRLLERKMLKILSLFSSKNL